MAQIYEGMYLLDNAAVREDWNAAKSIITDTLEKHGGKILSARRWDERRLAYPIKKKNRATFLLTYFEIPAENIPGMRRDFELNDSVLRSLELTVDAIPEEEAEFVATEATEDFKVPTPPDDDHIDFVEEPEDDGDDRPGRRDRDEGSRDGDSRAGGDENSEGDTEATAAGDDSTEKEAVKASEEN